MFIGLENFLIFCFLEKYNICSIGEILYRKYLDWRIFNFWFRKKVNIEFDIRSKKKYIKIKVKNYKRIYKIIKMSFVN